MYIGKQQFSCREEDTVRTYVHREITVFMEGRGYSEVMCM